MEDLLALWSFCVAMIGRWLNGDCVRRLRSLSVPFARIGTNVWLGTVAMCEGLI